MKLAKYFHDIHGCPVYYVNSIGRTYLHYYSFLTEFVPTDSENWFVDASLVNKLARVFYL